MILFCCSCASQPTGRVQTYADLKAEVCRYIASYQQSQLTHRPETGINSSRLSLTFFYQLPLSERVVCIMDSFAQVELDGEYSDQMIMMLTDAKVPFQGAYILDASDRVYTRAIFHTIDGYSEEQIRAFCWGSDKDYARFQKNLKIWRERCIPKLPEQ